jgi:hypothetical protein
MGILGIVGIGMGMAGGGNDVVSTYVVRHRIHCTV